MWREMLSNLSFAQFHHKIRDKKLVVIYPKTTYRNIFLSYYLHDTSQSLHYYQVRTDEKTIQLALRGLINDWDGFGKGLKLNSSAHDLGRAFAIDLGEFSKPSVVYLDELDHLEFSEDYANFFRSLVAHLPEKCQIVINSRNLSTVPWQEMLLDGSAVVLGTELLGSDLMFNIKQADRPQLEVHGFGQGHAIVNGREIEQWDGALPRNLFFYFVDKPLVTRDEIFEIFWPNLNIKEATNVYHVTKRKITEKISSNINSPKEVELTSYSSGFYHPSTEIVRHYDVAQFESDVEEASMTLDDAKQAALYRRAINLYKAPFLSSIDMPWVRERRVKLQRLFIEALIGLARIHKSAKQHEIALGYFARALRESPFREDLHREMMQLYVTMKYPEEARRQYQILTELLQDSFGLAPAPETQALFSQIS
jgi:DNA-binding SARP family transcriptional activator